MTDLRTAAQQALEALDKATRYMSDADYRKLNESIEELRAALAEPVQEPVAWGVFDGPNLHDVNFTEEEAHEMVRLKGDGSVVKLLYTAPPQRKPLTEEEIKQLLFESAGMTVTFSAVDLSLARAVERAHGIV